MSNPTFVQGPISFPAGQALEKYTLVAVNGEGSVVPAGASGGVFGAVTEKADPNVSTRPSTVAVHYGVAAVKLLADDADSIKAGAAVFAADGGKAAASGSVQVGVAARDGAGGKVLTVLNNLPTA